MPPLLFQPLASQPTPSFWSALTSLKLDRLKLDDSALPIKAYYQLGKSVTTQDSTGLGEERVGIDGCLVVGEHSLDESDKGSLPLHAVPVQGTLKVFNTIEGFRDQDAKKTLFNEIAKNIIQSFDSDTPLLNPFLLVTFADLKKYVYHYWFAFPVLISSPAWHVDNDFVPLPLKELSEIRQLSHIPAQQSFFLIRRSPNGWVSASLASFASFYSSGEQPTIVFSDPAALPNNPGWPLRNALFYLNKKFSVHNITVVCLRENEARKADVYVEKGSEGGSGELKTTGWERNAGKLAPRVIDLGPMMDPSRLSAQAVDLNLKLIKWRLLPSLDLDKISSIKCLLLGAGTLGCYVSRILLGWGVRNITLVDSGRVSYSNPVRQPLFNFEDCLNGGKLKALCAAERLRSIFPGVNATGVELSIPMPGHPVSSFSTLSESVEKLTSLIHSHDAVFLLMDSRESRWLPTLVGKEAGKHVINAALGFDSWLVMRHGAQKAEGADELGCYFCNDVVAPTDSLSDRTLDQMCTVTRPGVAPIASAMAVELLISLVQHPQGIHAPASTDPEDAYNKSGSPLGTVPHQLRGNLHGWQNHAVTGRAYDRCTACSERVLKIYREQGINLLHKVFNEKDYLEKLTGLDELHRESEKALEAMDEWDDENDDADF
ncbi:E1-like protein-activating enzyme Gsa7p/Apg7p [Cryptococcus depauperatus CBS 7841]|uniref:Ubiquitin-like modifier-activating enzyme ATG7 n=1 Tax=Cryptococcus depauperatus CBS 7841 TaxID=1295531 RepID=A0A1E3IB10_9TREE|nr:E1-like protein-activating enzyme Gsa7p/Apg7p [Cryptococcus depauperatus CBS 7841]